MQNSKIHGNCKFVYVWVIMGAKTSTANGGNGTGSGPHHQNHANSQQHNSRSPRTRTFSSSSSSATEVLPGGGSSSATGFNLLRPIPGIHVTTANQSAIDRQRARSLTSVPDLQQSNGNGMTQSNYLNGKIKHFGSSISFQLRTVSFSPTFPL